ncbi:DUF7504 family protein [Halorussus caseinilyticus]|uniref:DUF7504 family protein n=1 Tax=Halorussus caseinilyticus TaxID=3034025 RepID=UPI0023E80C0C|nr:hypothetical protein [Halorussus sp. DT72]
MSKVELRNERGDGPPDDSLARFQSKLRQLKSEGCNLLVVGDAPREVFTRASASMLGDPDARRWRVFALTDASPESVYDRLPAASAAPRPLSETTKIVNHALPPRPIADLADTPASSVPEVSVGDANLTGLRTELGEAMREFCSQSYRPAEVRVTVDSLAPLLDHYEFDVVRRFLRAVGERVYDCDAMAHYVLPRSYDSEWCRRLRPEFDAVVELRTAPEDPAPEESSHDETDQSNTGTRSHYAEERWHLPQSDTTMPWIPL